MMLSGARRELTRSLPGSLSGVYRQVVENLQGSSPEECSKFIGSSLKEIRSSSGVHRKDVESLSKRRSDNEH
ncbi:hypothetical protein GW17_00056724 [Ensete ventricosum]|nr:hypothetical protein GW17_00056724 [Ensete ventricosum]